MAQGNLWIIICYPLSLQIKYGVHLIYSKLVDINRYFNFDSYGSGYDNLGQGQGSKQDFSNYSATGNGTTGKSSGAQGSSGTGGPGKGEYINKAFSFHSEFWYVLRQYSDLNNFINYMVKIFTIYFTLFL